MDGVNIVLALSIQARTRMLRYILAPHTTRNNPSLWMRGVNPGLTYRTALHWESIWIYRRHRYVIRTVGGGDLKPQTLNALRYKFPLFGRRDDQLEQWSFIGEDSYAVTDRQSYHEVR